MSDSTPLLHDTDHGEFEAQTNLPAEKTPASAHFKPVVKILTVITLILSALTVALLIANYIILTHAPLGYYTWGARVASKVLGSFIFVSLVFSVINAAVNFPIALNIIIDLVLAAGIIPAVVRLIHSYPSAVWCEPRRVFPRPGYPTPIPVPVHPKCKDWMLAVKILMGISAGLGGIVAAIYVVLLALRIIAILRAKFWKRPFTWTFPTGTISLQISFKVLRQEHSTGGQSAEADSGVHGPVYL